MKGQEIVGIAKEEIFSHINLFTAMIEKRMILDQSLWNEHLINCKLF